ncbi:MAG: hypothetical protein ACOX2F_10325 [bacterium]
MEERRNKPEFAKSPKKWRYNFSKSLFTFWKTVKMYGGENERIDEEISFFRKVLDFFFEEKDEVSILFDGIDIKVDKVRIRGQRQDDKYFEDIYDLFLSLCLAGITFKKGVTDKEILEVFRIIGKYPVGREPKVQAFERVKGDLPNLDKVEIIPYDPEESGNLPIYSVKERVRKIYRTLASEYLEFHKMLDAVENIPLRIAERSSQDLISIIQNSSDKGEIDFLLFLTSMNSYNGSVEGASAASRTILSIMTGLKLGFDIQEVKRVAISAYFQYLSQDTSKGYNALSRMDEFNYSRIEAALNSSLKITDFSDEGIVGKETSSGTVSGDILKVVSYFDTVTKRASQPENQPPLLSKAQAVRKILENIKTGAFKREIAEAFATVVGIYPPGSILNIISTGEFCVSAGKFESFSDQAPVFILNKELQVSEIKTVRADNIVDVPDSAGTIFPPALSVNMLKFYLDDLPEPE